MQPIAVNQRIAGGWNHLDIFETDALEIAVDVPSVGGGIRAAPRTGVIS